MDSLLFAINAVAPIVLTVAVGYLLKRIGYISDGFVQQANKLCFRVFLPVMLFMNVYKIEDIAGIDLGYIVYVTLCVLILFALSFPVSHLATGVRMRRGVLCQAAFRSNYALIGIPLSGALFGDDGVAVATLLSAAVIPLFNILAVITLSVYSGERVSVRRVLTDIVKNPLIQAIALGLILLWIRMNTGADIRTLAPVSKVLEYLSGMATPVALLMLGAGFSFSKVGTLRREIIWGVTMRCVMVPLLGLGGAYLLFSGRFSGEHFAAFVAVFTTPLAVSSVAMAQEMNSDSTLAGQLVIWTTVISAFVTFAASFLLRSANIF